MNWVRIGFASAFTAATIWAGVNGSMMAQLKDLGTALPSDYDGVLATLPWRVNTIVLGLTVATLVVAGLQFRDPFPTLAAGLAGILAFVHYPAGLLRFDALWLKVGPKPVDGLTAVQQASSVLAVAVLVTWVGTEGTMALSRRLQDKEIPTAQIRRLRRQALLLVTGATAAACVVSLLLLNLIMHVSAWTDGVQSVSGRVAVGLLAGALLLAGVMAMGSIRNSVEAT